MGCDIHGFIEYHDEGAWVEFAELKLGRWYSLFGVLAGVRRKVDPLIMPRGVPNDLSIGVEIEFKDWEGDAHHPSWLTLDELRQVAQINTNQEFDAVIAAMTSLATAGHVARFVFWFDN